MSVEKTQDDYKPHDVDSIAEFLAGVKARLEELLRSQSLRLMELEGGRRP